MAAGSRRPPILPVCDAEFERRSPIAAALTIALVLILALPWVLWSDDGTAKHEDERLVAATLRRFADAYQQLDANAVAEVWPRADRRVLTRAFDSIESQEVYFERCEVQVAESGATASCGGWLRYVPKVGKKEPRFFNRRWDFALQKRAGEWRITTATVR
jgi:ketosteroid isomerase-like protein